MSDTHIPAAGDPGPERLECDVVMRGGITSGIVYPKAVAELAKEYNFHNVGGTSAGAIAAVVTAAAAYGRRQMERGLTPAPAEDPFTGRVDALPKELTASPDPSSRRYAGKTRLESLFQPARETAWAFDTLMGCLDRRGMARKVAAVAWTAIRAFPLAALIGLA
ncbi:MAG: patatin-like phospholipase family protein, partial [Hyphomicrobiales bacterium]